MTEPPQSSDREQSDADQALNTTKLDALIESSDKLTASNERLALAMVEYQERARLARVRFRWSMVAVAVVAVVALVGIYVQLNTAAQARAQLGDCIQPSGHCYQQGQERTAAAITAIVQAIGVDDRRVAARAAACAPAFVRLPEPARVRAIYQCIVRRHR